jgi:hypothetical protein
MVRKTSISILIMLSCSVARADAPSDVCQFFNDRQLPCAVVVDTKIINVTFPGSTADTIALFGSIFQRKSCDSLLRGIGSNLVLSTELTGWRVYGRTDKGKIITKCQL